MSREAQLGLEKSPFMDRAKHYQLPKQQVGFFKFLVLPLWKCFLGVFPRESLAVCRNHLADNRNEWERRASRYVVYVVHIVYVVVQESFVS